jgi:DNA repair protein Swi5/Sae3
VTKSSITAPAPADADAIVRRHIRLLHDYNEIKDVGQGLMGLIADARGIRHVDVQAEFGIGSKD